MNPQITMVRAAPSGIVARREPAPALGVLGGLFNPITRAHLHLGLEALKQFSLGEVLYVLPQVPPHKTYFGAGFEDRLAMLRLALESYDHFSLGQSTHGLFLDICQGLKSLYPKGTRNYFITGSDAAERILTWPYPDRRAALAAMFAGFDLIVANRSRPFTLPPDPLLQPYAKQIHSLTLPENFQGHSSTRARERSMQGRSVRDLLPEPVAAYIQKHGLYRKK